MKGLDALLAVQDSIKLTTNHRYYVDGRPVPGVTTIAKVLDAPALDAWRVRTQVEGTARAAYNNPPFPNEPVESYTVRLKAMAAEQYEADRVAKEAADDGIQVHALIAWRLEKMMGKEAPRPQVSEAAAFRESGWAHWAKDVRLKPLAVEAKLLHKTLRYCGTLDLLAEVEGRVGLWDYKRSSKVYESHRLQSSAYRMALESMGFDPMPGFVLLMPEGQDVTAVELDRSEESQEAWLSCLKLYNWTNSLKRAK